MPSSQSPFQLLNCIKKLKASNFFPLPGKQPPHLLEEGLYKSEHGRQTVVHAKTNIRESNQEDKLLSTLNKSVPAFFFATSNLHNVSKQLLSALFI